MEFVLDLFTFFLDYETLIINSIIASVVTGFIYGYSRSMHAGIGKTLVHGFFIQNVISTVILLINMLYLIFSTCLGKNAHVCFNLANVPALIMGLIAIISFTFFLTFASGYIGMFLGVLLYVPSEWFLENVFKISLRNSFRN